MKSAHIAHAIYVYMRNKCASIQLNLCTENGIFENEVKFVGVRAEEEEEMKSVRGSEKKTTKTKQFMFC